MGRLLRSRVLLIAALAADLTLYASELDRAELDAGSMQAALFAQARVTEDWLALDGVVGTAIGVGDGGNAVLQVYLTSAGAAALPRFVGRTEVVPVVTGPFVALPAAEADGEAADPKRGFERPVPIGVSTGHPKVTAGTIGARVTDGSRAFALSNNHILAASNGGAEGDHLLQPGVADGGRDPDDAIGALYDFEPLRFCDGGACTPNRIDAAIALTSADALGNETPEGGYGSPRPWTVDPALGLEVQKFGRTTALTTGRVTGIHATIDVQYRNGVARFEDQIVITGNGTFSAGGDSGSLVVTKGRLLGDRRPVGLLFAGSNVSTLANPIDAVLDRFDVRIDGR